MNVANVIHQLEQEKARLETAIVALRKLAPSANGTPHSTARRNDAIRHRSRLSAAGRRRIAEAQRARWAKQRQKKS